MKIYSYSRCSTCRKALNWLKEKNIKYSLIDIVENPPHKNQLVKAINQFGDRKYILNTSGLVYRSIGSEVIRRMSDNQLFEKLFTEPRLIKRPFLFKTNKS